MQELVLEQQLFSNILQTVLTPPYVIHSQCQTECQTLPTAKFDLLVTREACAIENEVMVVIETKSEENLDAEMSNKTDKTMNLKDKPSMLHNYRAFHLQHVKTVCAYVSEFMQLPWQPNFHS